MRDYADGVGMSEFDMIVPIPDGWEVCARPDDSRYLEGPKEAEREQGTPDRSIK